MESASAVIGKSGLRPRFYLMRGEEVDGPYPFTTVLKMMRKGMISREQPVSSDKVNWVSASHLTGMLGGQSVGGTEVQASSQQYILRELKHLSERVEAPSFRLCLLNDRILKCLFILIAVGCVSPLLYLVLNGTAHSLSRIILVIACIPVMVLFSWGVAESAGELMLRLITGLDRDQRCFLSLHQRHHLDTSAQGNCVKRWLQGYGWARPVEISSPEGYIHLFRTGKALSGVSDTVSLWETLARVLPRPLSLLCLPGSAKRDIQDVASLPGWSRSLDGLTDGVTLADILNSPYRNWMNRFLERARKNMGLNYDYPVHFLMYSYTGSNGECLLVAGVLPKCIEIEDQEMTTTQAA